MIYKCIHVLKAGGSACLSSSLFGRWIFFLASFGGVALCLFLTFLDSLSIVYSTDASFEVNSIVKLSLAPLGHIIHQLMLLRKTVCFSSSNAKYVRTNRSRTQVSPLESNVPASRTEFFSSESFLRLDLICCYRIQVGW